MATDIGASLQNANIPKLTGIQFDSSGEVVNLLRGSVSFPLKLLSLPGRNGLSYNLSIFYQSDVAAGQVKEWNLSGSSDIVGLGWSAPYEYIMVDPNSNGTLEDNTYYLVLNDQPARLYPINFNWSRGSLASSYTSYLNSISSTPTPIDSTFQDALFSQQINLSKETSIYRIDGTTWGLNDPTNERLYTLEAQDGGTFAILTGGISFELYNYQYWQIMYYPQYEKWEIVKNNGSLFTYGGSGEEIDTGIPANSIQYGIKWNNWIGPSKEAPSSGDSKQVKYANAWNLAKVENTLGNYYIINYVTVNQTVGLGTLSYTKSCLISKVKNDLDWSIVYQYNDKTYDNSFLEAPKEYLDPHKDPSLSASALNTADAYQSSYLSKYLTQVCVYNALGERQSYTNFEYYDLWNPNSTFGSTDQEKLAYGATYDRYLRSVTQYPGETYYYPASMLDRYAAPGMIFNYCFLKDDETQPQGLLTEIINANGGKTKFDYDRKEISSSNHSRSLEIPSPFTGLSSAVRTWAGPDYVVCCWYHETSNTFKLNVYTWLGKWVESFSNAITLPTPPGKQPLNIDLLQVVTSGNTFFVVMPPSSANLSTLVYYFNRSPYEVATWGYNTSTQVTQYLGNQIQVVAGNDFFLVQNNNSQIIDRYTWNSLSKTWSKNTHTIPSGQTYYMTAGDNYYVLFEYDNLEESGVFEYYGMDLYQNWSINKSLTVPSISIPGFEGFEYFQMVPSQSFVAISMITGYTMDGEGGFSKFDCQPIILKWDTSYNLSLATIQNLQNGIFNNLPSSMLNAFPGIGPVPINNTAIGYGPNYIVFDGVNWNCQSVGVDYEGFEDPSHQYYWYAYDEQGVIKTENTDSGILSLVGSIDPSHPSAGWNKQTLRDTPGHFINRYTQAYPTNAGQYITVGDQVYCKPLSSNWGTLGSNFLSLTSLLGTGETIDTTTVINGSDYIAFQILDSTQKPKDVGVVYFKNGTIVKSSVTPLLTRLENQQIFNVFNAAHVYKNNINGKLSPIPNGIVTSSISTTSLDSATSITLNKYSREGFDGVDQYAFVVKAINYDSGYDITSNCYVYEAPNLLPDGGEGAILKFYKVQKYLGCSDPLYAHSGYIESYFYNGQKVDPQTSTLIEHYSLLDGQLYKQVSYDNSNNIVAYTEMNWEVATEVAIDAGNTTYRNIYGGIPQVTRTTAMKEGIVTDAYMEYKASSGGLWQTTGNYYNSQNQNIQNKTQVTFAYEVYPGMWNQNILTLHGRTDTYVDDVNTSTPPILASSKVQTYQLWEHNSPTEVDYWTPWKHYVATNSTPSTFTWWTVGEPSSSNGWIKTGEVLERDTQGNVLSSQDLEGIKASTIYDDTDTFALATFHNATLNDGIFYTSFEEYQTNPWSLSGSGEIITTDSFTGNQCYQLTATGGNTSSISQTVNVANLAQYYSLNLWFKTPVDADSGDIIEFKITAAGSSTPITTTVPLLNGEWQSKQWVVNLSDLGVAGPANITINIKFTSTTGPGQLRIDDIIFSPVLSPFAAKSYDINKLRVVGELGANGVSSKPLYNMWGPYSAVGSYNQTSTLGSSSSVRQDPNYHPITDPFPKPKPNFSMEVVGRDQGFYDLFKSDESLENYTPSSGLLANWRVMNNAIECKGTGDQILKVKNYNERDIGAYVTVNPKFPSLGSNPAQIIYLGIVETAGISSRYLVQWNGTAPTPQWELLKWDGSSYTSVAHNSTVNWQPEWLLTVFEDRLFFTANGILIFNYEDVNIGQSSHTVQFGVNNPDTQDSVSFSNLTLVGDVQMAMSYKDGIGRTIQSLAVESGTASSASVIMAPSVYDAYGRGKISLLTSRLVQGVNGVTDPFAYYPGFITNGYATSINSIWSNHAIEGDIATYGYHSDAGGYPFSRVIYENSPLSRVVEQGLPGSDYAIGAINSHTTTYSYGINQADPGFLYPLTNNKYFKATVIDPDGKKTISYSTTTGQTVGTISTDAAGSNKVLSSQVHNLLGQVIATIPPKYYKDTYPSSQTSTIPTIASTYTYDFWGRKITSTSPETGTSYTVYDNMDRIRFSQTAEGATASTPYFNYMKYDILGRATEKGVCRDAWNTYATQSNANTPSYPTANITVSNTTSYDGDDTTDNMLGRTWQMDAHNGTIGDTADIIATYAYRPTGEIIEKTQAAKYNSIINRMDSMYYAYNINGRLLNVSDSITGLLAQYNVNKLGQTINTTATSGTKSVQASYSYDQKGRLKTANLYQPDGTTLLTDREFTYLPKGSLLNTTDNNFIAQELEYTSGSCGTPSGYYNGVLAHNSITYNGLLTPPSSDYCYVVDHLNRLTQANDTGGSNYSWAFDDNSNITSNTVDSETRTYNYATNSNLLTSITSTNSINDRSYIYNPIGDTILIKDGLNSALLTFEYNNWNGKAREIERPGDIRSVFDYGPNNGRIRKRIYNAYTNTITHTVYNTGDVEIEDDGTTTQTKRYISVKGAGLIYRLEDDTFYWAMPDHLGSTRMLVDEVGDVQYVYNYDIYGNPTINNTSGTADIIFNHLFTGQYWDGELQLYNYGARFYDPFTMRFLQVDPMGEFFSPYSYVGGMPNMLTDPSGMLSGGAWAGMAVGLGFSILAGLFTFGIGAAVGAAVTAGALTAIVGTAFTATVGLAMGVGAGALGAMAGDLTADAIDHQQINWKQIGFDGAAGAVSGLIGEGFGLAGGALATRFTSLAAKAAASASMGIAGAGISSVAGAGLTAAMNQQRLSGQAALMNFIIGAGFSAGGMALAHGAGSMISIAIADVRWRNMKFVAITDVIRPGAGTGAGAGAGAGTSAGFEPEIWIAEQTRRSGAGTTSHTLIILDVDTHTRLTSILPVPGGRSTDRLWQNELYKHAEEPSTIIYGHGGPTDPDIVPIGGSAPASLKKANEGIKFTPEYVLNQLRAREVPLSARIELRACYAAMPTGLGRALRALGYTNVYATTDEYGNSTEIEKIE